jgi:hypothetical protein
VDFIRLVIYVAQYTTLVRTLHSECRVHSTLSHEHDLGRYRKATLITDTFVMHLKVQICSEGRITGEGYLRNCMDFRRSNKSVVSIFVFLLIPNIRNIYLYTTVTGRSFRWKRTLL